MVDSTKDPVTEQIVTTTHLDKNLTTDRMLETTIANFRYIQEAILAELSINVSKVNDPQVNAKQQRAAVDALLQQLQSAIDKANARKVQEVLDMKDMLATQEQQLA